MRRVLIIGSGGSGKSTLARQLAERTGLPLIHLDQLFWRPGWNSMPDEEWDVLVAALTAGEAWIMDGNYGRTLPMRLERADTVIFMDVPPLVCLWRVVRRRWRYRGGSRPDVAPGCPDRLDWEFVLWILTYRHRRRPALLRRLESGRGRRNIIVLRTSAEAARYVAGTLRA